MSDNVAAEILVYYTDSHGEEHCAEFVELRDARKMAVALRADGYVDVQVVRT